MSQRHNHLPDLIDAELRFSDPDGDPLRFEAESSDAEVATVAVADSNVVVTGVSRGTAEITITASDPEGRSATQAFRVRVTRPNRAPRATGTISTQALSPGESYETDAARLFTDPDEDVLRYEATSSDDGVATATISGSVIRVEAVAVGSAEITLTATDPGGRAASLEFTVNVRSPGGGGGGGNEAPEVSGTVSAQSVTEGEDLSVKVGGLFTDPDNDALRFGATSSNDAVAEAEASGDEVTVLGVSEGTATITVTATDPGGLSASLDFGVTVEPYDGPNRAPVVVSTIADQTISIGKTFGGFVNEYFRDPDNNGLRLDASSTNTTAVTVRTTHLPLVPAGFLAKAEAEGTARVTLEAIDPAGLSASLNFEVTAIVGTNNAPEVSNEIPDFAIKVGGEERIPNLHNYFTDPDGDGLFFGATSSHPAIVVAGRFGFRGFFVAGISVGVATVTVTATDELGLSVSQLVTVTVSAN